MRKNTFRILAAATMALGATAAVHAADLHWSPGSSAPTDGDGLWDLTSPNWFNGSSNVAWTQGSNAIFGDASNTFNGSLSPDVDLAGNIQVQDMTFNISGNGATHLITDFSGGQLTLLGNVYKPATNGPIIFQLSANSLVLGAGQHTFQLHDSPGDAPAEMTIDGVVSGSGGITLDNGTYESWGTLSLTHANTYTGPTVINRGRLVIADSNGLGTGDVTISGAGTLSLGGAGVGGPNLTIPNRIIITRDTYTGGDANDGGAFSHYGAAFTMANSGQQTSTVTGAIVINSADARIRAESGLLVLPNIQVGSNAPAGAVLSLTGDFAGYIQLTGNNTAIPGGIKLVDGVEVIANNQNALGGPSSSLTFAGSATLQVTNSLMQDFGTHAVNYGSFSGGIDVLNAGDTFTISQNLTGASIGKRGAGTLVLSGTNLLNSSGTQTFWDSGTVNVTGSTTLSSLHLRSPVVNITGNGSITTTAGYNSFGQDSTGTNGGPDKAVINISGNGALIQTSGDDFNISDNANTQGTINISGNGVLTTGGITWLGKGNGAVGSISQTGGTVTVNRNGNFALVLGDARGKNVSPTGYYNISGGTLNVAGEMYMGEGNGGAPGIGVYTQSGGNVTVGSWVVFGREGAYGTADISGGTFTETGGNFSMGESNSPNTLTLRGNAQLAQTGGEFWVGNNGGNQGTLNIQDTASLTVTTNWIAVGRGGATGVVNMSGGSISKSGGGNFTVGSNGTGTVNQTGGTITISSGDTYVGEGGTGTLNLSGGAFNAQALFVGNNGGSTGTVNISGTAAVTAGAVTFGARDSVNGELNLRGGSLNVASVGAGGSSGTKTFNFTGGTLTVGNYNLGDLSNNGTGKLAPGGVGTVGTTSVTAAYSQGANATLAIDIASDSSYDQVTAGASSIVNGSLSVDSLGAYTPTPGVYFNVFTVTSGTLTAAPTLTGPDAAEYKVRINGNVLQLTSVNTSDFLRGDLNFDGNLDDSDTAAFILATVDEASYISTYVPAAQQATFTDADFLYIADFNYDGNVDDSDTAAFIQATVDGFFPPPPGLGAGRPFSAAVPEPTSASLLAIPALAGLTRRRRR